MLHLEGFNDGFDLLHGMRVLDHPAGIASPEKPGFQVAGLLESARS
jgi:hypothetical protein